MLASFVFVSHVREMPVRFDALVIGGDGGGAKGVVSQCSPS